MSIASAMSAEHAANYLTGYLCDRFADRRHVRRVAHWLGFLLKAIERASDGDFRINRERQIKFTYRGWRFKARYKHRLGGRGGIEIVGVIPERGEPDAGVAVLIKNLDNAEDAYHNLEKLLDEYIDS